MASPNSYTTSTLVTNVTLISHMPVSNSTFTSTEIINLANRELQTALISQILSVREGYYLTYVDYESTVDGQYPIPPQAIAGAISAIQLVTAPSVIPVNRLDMAEQFSTESPNATSYGYFMKGNTIQVLPYPTDTVRVWFARRPNALIATSAAGEITVIAGADVTVASLPSTFAIGTDVDLCADQPTFDVLGNRNIDNIAATTVTLDSAVTNLAVGDWLCLENQTPVPQIPVEFRPLLEQRVVVKVYELQGYLDKMKAAKDVLTEMEKDMFKLISPRNESQTKVINPQNGGFTASNSKNATQFWSSR